MQEGLQTGDVVEPTNSTEKPRSNNRGFGVREWQTKLRWSIMLSISLFLVDRLLKQLVVSFAAAADLGLVEFAKFMNDGIVFSLPVPQWIYLPIAVIVYLIFAYALVGAIRNKSEATYGLSLVVLGALSNLIDRFLYDATVDYLIFFDRSAVNVADGMILLGVILFIRAQKKSSSS